MYNLLHVILENKGENVISEYNCKLCMDINIFDQTKS